MGVRGEWVERKRAGGVAAREGQGRPEREQGVRGGSRPGGARASGSEAEEGERKRKEKKKKRKGEKKWEKGKEIGKKKMGGRERKRRGAVRASGDRDCGRPRVACGRGRWGTRSEGREEKGGAGFAAAGHDVSRWMGKR